ncbi:MAG: hypothetical protein JOZ15_07875 [Acidobacteria bacterium]|nr:hypothetical protein [Acidobacteriota bacterium]
MRRVAKRCQIVPALVLLCLWSLALPAWGTPAAQPVRLTDLRGAWRAEDGALLQFQPDRVLTFEKGELAIGSIVKRDGETLILRRGGLLETWRLGLSGGVLKVQHAGKSSDYKPLADIPHQMDLKPYTLPPPVDLPASQIVEAQTELAERLKRDQAAVKSKDQAR